MIKKAIKSFMQSLGYKISKTEFYKDPFEDIKRLLKNKSTPVIFDVGANVGQSINRFKKKFPKSTIYSFEPGSNTYLELSAKYNNRKDIHLENIAVGSENNKKEFLENENSDMSSFLEIDRSGWGKISNKILVDTITIDNYCQTNGIPTIDILKSDTQGFELEVYKGAIQMMKSNNIHLAYFEFIFSDMYKNLPSFDEIYKLLKDNNFRLVNFYDFHYQNGLISWVDVLFVNSNYMNNQKKR